MSVDRESANEERNAWRMAYEKIGLKAAQTSSLEEKRELIGGQRHTYPIPKREFYFKTVDHKPQFTLDVGCGLGNVVGWLHEDAEKVVAMDFAFAVLQEARKRLDRNASQKVFFVVADAVALPFADASFDRLTCLNLLPLLTPADAIRALEESGRVSKYHASVIFTIRNKLSPYAFARGCVLKLAALMGKKKRFLTNYCACCWCRRQLAALGMEILTEHSHGLEPFPAPACIVRFIRSIEVMVARVTKALRPFGVNYLFEAQKFRS